MNNQSIWKSLVPSLILTAFSFFSLPTYSQLQPVAQMQAHFINVGQADATLLEFPCGAILIDAGAEDLATQDSLIRYLKRFFIRRADLHSTLDLVILSHDHIDHDSSLRVVFKNFQIKNFIDNGHFGNHSGEPIQGDMERLAKRTGINYESFSYEQITANGNQKGLTDGVLDPIHCSTVTPQITVLSSRFDQQPANWSDTDYTNENNHSVVVRVQFGKASFLFTGDLETAGDKQLVSFYQGSSALDVDVWKVSHHGAANGTNKDLLDAISPKYAVICVGPWFDGDHTKKPFNTYHFGHPRVSTLNFLSTSIPDNRLPIDTNIVAFNGIKTKNVRMKVTKNIYATAWDHNITIKATSEGQYTIITKDK